MNLYSKKVHKKEGLRPLRSGVLVSAEHVHDVRRARGGSGVALVRVAPVRLAMPREVNNVVIVGIVAVGGRGDSHHGFSSLSAVF